MTSHLPSASPADESTGAWCATHRGTPVTHHDPIDEHYAAALEEGLTRELYGESVEVDGRRQFRPGQIARTGAKHGVPHTEAFTDWANETWIKVVLPIIRRPEAASATYEGYEPWHCRCRAVRVLCTTVRWPGRGRPSPLACAIMAARPRRRRDDGPAGTTVAARPSEPRPPRGGSASRRRPACVAPIDDVEIAVNCDDFDAVEDRALVTSLASGLPGAQARAVAAYLNAVSHVDHEGAFVWIAARHGGKPNTWNRNFNRAVRTMRTSASLTVSSATSPRPVPAGIR